MIMASDKDAQFDCSVNEVGDRFQARWTAFIVATEVGQSESDLRNFERRSDAWAWIYAEAAKRGFHRIVGAGP
jgi:hypothetical protein